MNLKPILGGLFCVMLLVSMGLLMPAMAGDHDLHEIQERRKEFLYILGEGDVGILEIEMMQDAGFNYIMNSGQRPIAFHMYSEDDVGDITHHIGPRNTTQRMSGIFVAPEDGVYVFFTERREPREATVRLTINGEFGIVNMTGMEPATEVPGPALVPMVVVGLALMGVHRHRRARIGDGC